MLSGMTLIVVALNISQFHLFILSLLSAFTVSDMILIVVVPSLNYYFIYHSISV